VAGTAANYGRCITYSGGTTAIGGDQTHYIQIASSLPNYIVLGTCATELPPSGCDANSSDNWTTACIGNATYSASGTQCWCRLKRLSDGAVSSRYVFHSLRSPASFCAEYCAGVCTGYLNNQIRGAGNGTGLLNAFLNAF
jgi:hypothetical protein